MKKISALILFFSIFTACVQSPVRSLTANPSPTSSTKVIAQTGIPSAIPTYTTTPPSTASNRPTPLIGQVSIQDAQISYYDITGATASELRQSMNKLRPRDPYDGDKPVDSYTGWYIAWNWPGYGTEDCDLSAAAVTYSINVTMPRWKTPANASPQLIAKWEKYVQTLVLHEKGHVDNIVSHYLSVKTAIQNATCSTAEAEAQKALDLLRKFDSNYDSTTKHGQTQGAVFP
ncbi:MAG TPA: DUF922 domain-containing protein [Anaerolineales bacterium]|nr:DUF922 domain-containing protein [Anaerolineales bacterium]